MRETALRRLLWLDCAIGSALAMLLAMASDPMSRLLGLPPALQLIAVAILLAAAALMAFTAKQQPLFITGAWLVVVGNGGWVLASVGLVLAGGLTQVGTAVVLVQAVAVFGLAALEATALRRATARAA